MCTVKETTQGQTVTKNTTVKVLGQYTHGLQYTHTDKHTQVNRQVKYLPLCLCADRGYVYLWPSGETNMSTILHHTVEFTVEVDAHPAPTVLWTKNNQTIDTETTSISTTHLRDSR